MSTLQFIVILASDYLSLVFKGFIAHQQPIKAVSFPFLNSYLRLSFDCHHFASNFSEKGWWVLYFESPLLISVISTYCLSFTPAFSISQVHLPGHSFFQTYLYFLALLLWFSFPKCFQCFISVLSWLMPFYFIFLSGFSYFFLKLLNHRLNES